MSAHGRPNCSVPRATAAGCKAVLIWGEDNVAATVRDLTNGGMADVVYDGIGKDTFNASLDSLRPRGLMVSIGASSGLPAPVAPHSMTEDRYF